MGIFTKMWRLIDPQYCVACGQRLPLTQLLLCTRCHLNIPTTSFAITPENPVSQRCRDLQPLIKHASALLYYQRGSHWRDVVHRLKYKRQHKLGDVLGTMLGRELAKSPIYQNVDFVVAVPLHPLRRISRGYNQCHYIAKAVAREMGLPYRGDLLKRVRHNASQVSVEHNERWRNVEHLFGVVRSEEFRDRSVLIIDDVLTTGATTISCAEAVIDAEPSCQVYIAAVAVSEAEFGLEAQHRS